MRLPFEEKTYYHGYWNRKMNQRQDYGICVYDDGSLYEGFWLEDVEHGKGRFVSKRGSFYEGDFIDGEKHGFGRFVHSNNTMYDGEWA